MIHKCVKLRLFIIDIFTSVITSDLPSKTLFVRKNSFVQTLKYMI